MKPLRHVMCVDDEVDILQVMKLCLELNGSLNVTCCKSGQEALHRLPEIRPDLVLLDVMMPGQDGPATLSAMRKSPSCADVPVVFVTARIREAESLEYLAMGASGVLAKPFDSARFCSDVEEIWSDIQKRQSVGEAMS